jgi:hypothetical protein
MTYDDDNDDDYETVVLDGRRMRILKDGRRMRVPMMMADAAMRRIDLHDGFGREIGGGRGYRRGYIIPTDQTLRDAALRAREENEAQQREAWRSPPTANGPSPEPVVHRRQNDGRTEDAREAAYLDYELPSP